MGNFSNVGSIIVRYVRVFRLFQCCLQMTLITRHSNPGVVWFEAQGAMFQNVMYFSTNVLNRFPGSGGEASESPAGRPEEERSGPESQGQERFALLDPPAQ